MFCQVSKIQTRIKYCKYHTNWNMRLGSWNSENALDIPFKYVCESNYEINKESLFVYGKQGPIVMWYFLTGYA